MQFERHDLPAMATPGFLFICQALPVTLSPLALTSLCFHLGETYLNAVFSAPAKVVMIMAVYLGALICTVQWRSYQKRNGARQLGAKLIPVAEGTWIGNVDRMIELARVFDTSYLGE